MTHGRLLAIVVGIASGALSTAATAQGFMSFQANGGTTVKTGEAGSYMRAGLDWDHAAVHLVGGIAVPTVINPADITTWRDASALHFTFSIPDQTTTNSNGPTSTLSCGEQVIIQIDKANAKTATLAATGFFRYDVLIPDPLTPAPQLSKRLPEDLGSGVWDWAALTVATTASVSMPSFTNGKLGFSVTIPLADIGTPTGDIGIALALINDLGHSHVSGGITQHEMTGTAFPATMGLVPESDPALTCGTGTTQTTEDATGNWVKPNTWGTGFWNLSNAMVDVTFSQSPHPALSDAIRIGKCTAPWSSIPAVPSLTDWDTFQHTSNTWYVFNVDKPCRMAIWFTPKVGGPVGTVVNRRFFVVFGRPNIAPQQWYVAGVTGEVPVSGSSTPVSFIWDQPTAIPFTDHPCFKIYALQSGTTSADSGILLGITTQVRLDSVETANNASLGNSRAAQMNFANIDNVQKTCNDAFCQPLSLRDATGDGDKQPRVVMESAPFSRTEGVAFLQDSARRRGRPPLAKDSTPTRDSVGKSVRIIAYGYGVANPTGNKPYVYVEPIGALGWAVPAASYANRAVTLNVDFNNPRVVETAFVGGRRIDVPAPARRLLVALKIDVPVGTPSPRIDLAAVNANAERLVPPGDMNATRIVINPTHRALPLWIWLLVALVVVIVLVVRFVRSRPAP